MRRTILSAGTTDTADTLQTIAEISIAFAGFSGLIVAFRKRPGPLTPVHKFRLQLLLALSFGALFLSFLPNLFQEFGAAGPAAWTAASAVFILYSLIFNAWLAFSSLRTLPAAPEIFNRYAYLRMVTGHVVVVGLVGFVLLSGRNDLTPAAFQLGLIWLLLHAAQQFCRLLFVRVASEV